MTFSLRNPAFVASLSGGVSPTQALVNSFAGTGLLDALLVFDPTHFTAPGSTGHLVDALGGSIYYDAPGSSATPATVTDSSGYYYASADGVDDTLIASANQTVAWYCAVMRSPPGQTVWNDYGAPVESLTNSNGDGRLGLVQSGGADWYSGCLPRRVRRNGIDLAADYDLAPITTWAAVSVATSASGSIVSQIVQLMSGFGMFYPRMHLAALAIRYTDPTSDQQTQIEAKLAPMRDALLAS